MSLAPLRYASDCARPVRGDEGSGPRSKVSDFSIGICASGETPETLSRLMKTIRSESFAPGLELARIIIVGSGCGEESLRFLRELALEDERVLLITQPERRGKADAINQIIRARTGEFLVFVNADALPAKGAISRILATMQGDPSAGIISGSPVIEVGVGLTDDLLAMMWEVHNVFSRNLNDMHLSNHSTDELMVVRSEVAQELPDGVVNDGAFMGGRAHAMGYHVRYLQDAKVRVEVPQRITSVVKQRRRILYGHIQVWRLLGRAPKTAESLLVLSPGLGLPLVVRTLARRPRFILALPAALVCEGISLIGAIADSLVSARKKKDKHAVWERYDH